MLREEHRNGLLLFSDDALSAAGAANALTTRSGGVSRGVFESLNLGTNRGDDPACVLENYRRLCAALGVDIRRVVFSSQVHGDTVRRVTEADAGKGLFRPVDYDADALMTDAAGLPLMIFSADCLPILLAAPGKAVGAAHAGWRGTALGIAGKTAREMAFAYGCDPASMRAAVGPGASLCCFETDHDVPEALLASYGDEAASYMERRGTKWHVDLKGLSVLSLTRAGLLPENISVSPECTICRPDRYWSHRVTNGVRGSQGAMICLTEDRRSL
ncbi:MAG TPA: polyphenol oxidase family protein [Oscillospiraceae bacterium]|nr:polyphenol oxidase family protein [Oscillospiraceae bacterium]